MVNVYITMVSVYITMVHVYITNVGIAIINHTFLMVIRGMAYYCYTNIMVEITKYLAAKLAISMEGMDLASELPLVSPRRSSTAAPLAWAARVAPAAAAEPLDVWALLHGDGWEDPVYTLVNMKIMRILMDVRFLRNLRGIDPEPYWENHCMPPSMTS